MFHLLHSWLRQHVCAKSHGVVHQTHDCAALQQHVITALHDLQVCKARELRLIQNQHLLLSPPVKLKVKPLDTHAD